MTRRLTLVLLLVLAGLPVLATTPASAQARLVNALVHTIPERPRPGDDVTVLVDVTGCSPGPVTVELYLTTSDGAQRSSVLMSRAAARRTLLFRTKASLALDDAIEGWYGARVLCGTFRPPKEPMANTIFAVGAVPVASASLEGTATDQGGTVPMQGDGCPGQAVQYDLSPGGRYPGAFEVDGSITVAPGGTWRGDVAFPEDAGLGPVSVRARCAVLNQFGETLYVYYGEVGVVDVSRPAA